MPSILTPPLVILTLNGKGGVGKTLFSLTLIDLFDLNNLPLNISQLDDQLRLPKTIGRKVFTPDLNVLKRARRDPSALTSSLNPLYDKILDIRKIGQSHLIDLGATTQNLFFEYAALTQLSDDLQEFQIPSSAFIPVTAEPEAIRQAAEAIINLKKILPETRIFIVENMRDGLVFGTHASPSIQHLVANDLLPTMEGVAIIKMPKIEANSWSHFERHFARLIDVIPMSVPEIMELTGFSRPEAKLSSSDVAAYFDAMEIELSNIFPFSGGKDE